MTRPSTNRRVLFLYEGDTEDEFFPCFFDKHLKRGEGIEIKRKQLKGIANLASKVADRIYNHLENLKEKDSLFVLVLRDKDKKKHEGYFELDTKSIEEKLNDKRLKEIREMVVTQELESAFFIDIDGIYNYIRAPKTKRNSQKYQSYQDFNSKDLKHLIETITEKKKTYVKGKKAKDLIQALDMAKIYDKCEELQKVIAFIKGK